MNTHMSHEIWIEIYYSNELCLCDAHYLNAMKEGILNQFRKQYMNKIYVNILDNKKVYVSEYYLTRMYALIFVYFLVLFVSCYLREIY